MLVVQFGVEVVQLVEQHLVLFLDVVGIARHHEEQKRVALDVPQKAQPQAFSFACALDDAGDVGHHKRLMVVIGHDAQRWFEGGEGVVGNLRTCRRERREQR